MKKIYFFLVAMVVTSLSFSQGSESFANSNATASYTDNNFVGDNGVTWTYVHSRNANGDANGSGISLPALMLRRNTEPSSVTSSSVAGGITDFSVKLYKGFTGAGDRQVELFVNGVSKGSSIVFDDNLEHIFSVTGINVGGNVTIELRNITAKQVIVDDITWTAYAGPATPSLTITSPAPSALLPSGDATIQFAVNNFNVATAGLGDGHIHYTVDGGGDVMKYDTTDIMLSGLAPGSHTVVMKLVDDSHVDIAPAVSDSVTFDVISYAPASDISILRAGVLNDYYELTGEALLTFQQSYRGQKFIEDNTGAILIDDNNGIITTSYNILDGITGIKGQLGSFGGMMQFVPMVDSGAATSTGNTLTPQAVTLAMLAATPENYESELVTVTTVMMSNTVPAATPNFADGIVHEMDQSGNKFNFRSTFFGVDYIGELVPTVATDVTGIVNERSGSLYYLTARNADDISQVTLSIADNVIEKFQMFPNPSSNGFINITTANNSPKNVQVFDMLGKKIIDKEVESKLNISSLQAGIYIVKVTENNLSATKRLIVK